jgi:hypothetical protein
MQTNGQSYGFDPFDRNNSNRNITMSFLVRNRFWIGPLLLGVMLLLLGLTWLSSYLRSGSFSTTFHSARVVHEGPEGVITMATVLFFGTLLLISARKSYRRMHQANRGKSDNTEHR